MYILFIRIKNAFVELSADIIYNIQWCTYKNVFLEAFFPTTHFIRSLCSSDERRSLYPNRSSYNAIYLNGNREINLCYCRIEASLLNNFSFRGCFMLCIRWDYARLSLYNNSSSSGLFDFCSIFIDFILVLFFLLIIDMIFFCRIIEVVMSKALQFFFLVRPMIHKLTV